MPFNYPNRLPLPAKEIKAPMPDVIYFVTWCDPAKYNKGPEQEYYWCSEKSNAFAKVGECHLAGYENVALYEFQRKR